MSDDDGIAISYTVLARGTPVRSADGVEVGTVRRVLDNAREHIFDGIDIDTPDGRRFVDAPEVRHIAERAVTLTISAAAVRDLPAARGGRERVDEAPTMRRVKRLVRNLRGR
ncbi:MAG: hypothetical protein QOG35_2614 [Solirubrobacteraceae bacterium]|nr:hypothetical protein [Solirubrobacteraceae bacterium]